MAKKFLTGITIATAVGGEYTFPIADGSANQAIVTDGNGNLSFGSAIASTAEDAQRLVCEMINASGSSISAFRPVCCVGIHSDGTPEIALARADNPLFMPAIGITQSSVGNNNRTDVLLYGKLEGVNTTPYATGDTLYVAPTGGWTTTRPTGNNLIQAVFKVGRIQQNNGSGGAFGAGQYQDLPNVPEGNVWIGNSNSYPIATPLSTAIPAALGYTPVPNSRTITINGTTYDLSANRAWTITTDASARSILRYVATASQTTFTISGGYTPGLTDVYRNGVKLDNSTDFTATNGTTIVLTNGASVNDVIEVYRYQTAFLANNALRVVTEFIATAGQTTFNVTYNSGLVDVFYNGSKLLSTEYAAGNGTTIVLNFPCNLNDTLEVHAYSYAVGAFTGQAQLNGTGFVKANGTTITYDNSTYLTSINSSQVITALGFTPYNATNPSGYITSSALSSYLPLSGGTLTGALSGTSATFSGLITANAGLLLGTSQAVGATGTIGFNSTQGLYIYCKTGSAYDFKFYNGVGSTFMQVPTGTQNVEFLGNIGLGVSNTQTQLHINGTITFSEPGFDTARLHSITHQHSAGSNPNNYIAFNVSNGFNSTTERLRINGDGYVGIGNWSINVPQDTLHVNGSIQVGFVNSLNNAMRLFWNGASSYGAIQTSSSSSLALNPSGNNVIVGTTSDNGNRFQVNGSSTFSSTVTLSDNLLWNTGAGNNWYIQGQANGPTIRMKYHGGSTDRSGALGWIDNSGNRYDALTWQDASISVTGTSVMPRVLGKNYNQTSGSGTGTAIVDTGITYNTGDFGGYGRGVTYQVVYNGNPNGAGSSAYYAQYVGILIIYTGWSGSAVTTYIQFTQLAGGSNIGNLTLTPVFWNGSSESSSIGVYSAGAQIRLKISGYNSSATGQDQAVYLTRIS